MKLAQMANCTSGGGRYSLYLVILTNARMEAENR